MDESYLLKTETARSLYEKYAKNLPIVDFHNHVSVADIAADRKYASLTELWITPDPYKHRLMRICGVPEHYVTGGADDYEKFEKFCEIFHGLAGIRPRHAIGTLGSGNRVAFRRGKALRDAKAVNRRNSAVIADHGGKLPPVKRQSCFGKKFFQCFAASSAHQVDAVAFFTRRNVQSITYILTFEAKSVE